MIFPKYKLIFIHIPKTGGTSLTHGLFKCEGKDNLNLMEMYRERSVVKRSFRRAHISASDYIKHMGDEYYKHYSFTIIRNPFEQIRSLFAQLKNMNLTVNPRFRPYKKMLFEEYVMGEGRCSLEDDKALVDQLSMITHNGDIKVNDVFVYEDYNKVCKFISEKTGCHISTDVVLRQTFTDFKYSPEMIERVLDLYGHVYEYYKSKK